MKRTCKSCNWEGEETEFAKAHEKNGKIYYRHLCKTCYWKVGKKPRRDELRRKLEEHKKNSKCEHCSNADYRVLEFHHTNPKLKDDTVCNMVLRGISWDRIEKEMRKCLILCANCHKIEHHKRGVA